MKKILALAVGMLLIPFTAFGMQMMSEADLDSITGQSGVAISIDNIQIYSDGGEELWYETTNTTNGAAAVGLVYGASASYTFLNKIASPLALAGGGSGLGNVAGNRLLRGNYDPLVDLYADGLMDQGPRLAPSVLSIRVASTDTTGIFGGGLTDGTNTGAYIEIGLPTLEIFNFEGSVDTIQIFVVSDDLYGVNPVGSGAPAWSLGTIYYSEGNTTAILGGRVGITSLGQVPQAATSSGLGDGLDEVAPW